MWLCPLISLALIQEAYFTSLPRFLADFIFNMLYLTFFLISFILIWLCNIIKVVEESCAHARKLVVVLVVWDIRFWARAHPSPRSPTIVSWWFCRYPERPLSLPECRLTSVPANSGTPYVLFSAKVMLKFSVNFSMTLLKIGHMGYLRLMHGPGYLST